ncbi:hypothetical protein ABPG72_022154 [Tetrahymena utriculariae]
MEQNKQFSSQIQVKQESQQISQLEGQVEQYNQFFQQQIDVSKNAKSDSNTYKLNKNIQIIQKGFNLEIQTQSNFFNEALSNLKELEIFFLKIKNIKKIKLQMSIQFKDSQGRLNFSQNFLKLTNSTPFIQQLHLKITGNISKEQSKKLIESLKSFPTLNSLELNYHQSILDDEVSDGISQYISDIQTLHTLKIFARIEDFISKKLSRKSIIHINNACYKLLHLEIFQFPYLLERNTKNSILPVSNFLYYRASNSYNYSLQHFLPFQMEDFNQFKQQLQQKRYQITSVVFYEYQSLKYHTDFIEIQEQDYLNKLDMVFNLPYLTYFFTNFFVYNNHKKIKRNNKICQIQGMLAQRVKCLIQIITFQKFISPPLQLNPHLVLFDLHID